jgi:hypothetical protein
VASQLLGLFRKLTWNDFKQVTKSAPGPGQSANVAQTRTNVGTNNFSLPPVRGTKPLQYQLANMITVSITLDAANCWKANWLATLSQADQDRLLKHEQGHYDLVALLGRDYFLELMQLKTNTYTKMSDFQADLKILDTQYLKQIQPVQDKYDSDTTHGRVQARQDAWNGYIHSAFTLVRIPAATDAGGISLKQPILDVLSRAGMSP